MRALRGFTVLSVMLCMTINLHSQTEQWEQLHGPYGGQLYRFLGLFVDDITGNIYVGRIDGVLYSTNQGTNWAFDRTGRVLVSALCLNGNRELVAGTRRGILYRDESEGRWYSCSETAAFTVWSLAYDPVSGALVAGCADGSLLRSADHGRTWQIGSISSEVTCRIGQLVCDQEGRIHAGTDTQGAWTSSDGGVKWSCIGQDILPLEVRSVAVQPGRDLLVVCGPTTLCRSSDHGESWVECTLPVDSENAAAAVCMGPDGRLSVGTDHGIFASDDLGDTWRRMPMCLPDTAIDQFLYSDRDGCFIVATVGGIFRSSTGEAPWELIGTPLEGPYDIHFTDDGLMLVSTMFNLAVTTDAGVSWRLTGLGGIWGIDSDETQKVLYAGGNKGMYRSTDRGYTWESVNDGLGSTSVYAVKVLQDGTVLAGATDAHGVGGVYASVDHGLHWEGMLRGLEERDIYWIEASPDESRLYAGTMQGTVYRYEEERGAWVWLTTLPDVYPTIAVSEGGVVFVGTAGGGIHGSADGGDGWEGMNSGIPPDAAVNWITVNRTGAVFAGCDGAGIFKSVDSGAHWQAVNAGLLDSIIYCLALDADQHLYAGTMYGGVFRTRDATVRIKPIPPRCVEIVLKNYPNPFCEETRIDVLGWSPSMGGSLVVCDALGRVILDLTPGLQSSGSFRITGNMLPGPGVYFCLFQAGDRHSIHRMLFLE